MKNLLKKIKHFFIKLFIDKKCNNIFIWLLTLLLLIVGCVSKIPSIYVWGFIIVNTINSIIKKVVRKYFNKKQNIFNKDINIKGGNTAL